jgi:hypothetical protein
MREHPTHVELLFSIQPGEIEAFLAARDLRLVEYLEMKKTALAIARAVVAVLCISILYT